MDKKRSFVGAIKSGLYGEPADRSAAAMRRPQPKRPAPAAPAPKVVDSTIVEDQELFLDDPAVDGYYYDEADPVPDPASDPERELFGDICDTDGEPIDGPIDEPQPVQSTKGARPMDHPLDPALREHYAGTMVVIGISGEYFKAGNGNRLLTPAEARYRMPQFDILEVPVEHVNAYWMDAEDCAVMMTGHVHRFILEEFYRRFGGDEAVALLKDKDFGEESPAAPAPAEPASAEPVPAEPAPAPAEPVPAEPVPAEPAPAPAAESAPVAAPSVQEPSKAAPRNRWAGMI